MSPFFNRNEVRNIVWKQIEKDESPGEQVGGSGHLSQVDCKIDYVGDPIQVPDGWEITYRYTVSITTEFTIYPDNPPWENVYEKTIVVDEKGIFVKVRNSKIISSNIESIEYIDSVSCDDSMEIDEELVQRVVDLKTGRDITGEYITQRLRELEILADDIIQNAAIEADADPERKRKIYEITYWEIHEKLGTGSIGPATAVAYGLMEEKKEKLGEVFGIKKADRLSLGSMIV